MDADTAPRRVRRHTWSLRQPLIDAVVLILKGDGVAQPEQRAQEIAIALERGARLADAGFKGKKRWRSDPGLGFAAWYREQSIRLDLVDAQFQRRRGKEGAEKASKRAARYWVVRLTNKHKRRRVAPPPPLMWEKEIAEALILTLKRELGRPLRFSHSAHRRNHHGPDVKALAEAFELARKVCWEAPRLSRGKGVRQPGTAGWFESRLRTCRRHTERTAASRGATL